VYTLCYRQTAQNIHIPQYAIHRYIGCLLEIEIQIFKKLIGRKK